MAEKYNVEEKLHTLMDIFDEKFKEDDKRTISFVTIQGETYGGSIQRREYSMDYNDFAAFNLIVGFTDRYWKCKEEISGNIFLVRKSNLKLKGCDVQFYKE